MAEPDANLLLVGGRPDDLRGLEAAGCGLVRAASADEALRLLSARDFAAVLLGLTPEGLGAARRLRAGGWATPILFLAGGGDAGRLEEAYGLGAVDHIADPPSPVILRAKVADLVDRFRRAGQASRPERRRSGNDARLRVSEERFARFMRHLPGLAWIKDARGRYVFVNDAAVRAFGRPRELLYGRTDEEIFPPETAARFKEHDRRALADPAGAQVIETLRHPDGAVHHSLVTKFAIPGPDGQPALVGGMAIDVTQQRQTREALEESEQRFRQLAENVGAVFWMSDPEKNRILYVSPAYETVWGRPCQSLYERPRSFLDAIHPEDRGRVDSLSLEPQRRGEASDVEYRVIRPDGSMRWVRDRGFPVRDSGGRLYRVVGIAEDVTQMKEAEEALRQKNEELAAASRHKDEFLAMLAHELRNPLAPLKSALDILRRAGGDAEAAGRAVGLMDRQVNNLVRLVDDLLDVSRITRGRIELRKRRIDLAAAVQLAVETVRPVVNAAGHELSVALPAEPVPLQADLTRLEQVIANLLNNAAKYTEPGGKIWLTAGREGGEAVVRVRDNGIGIAPTLLPRLFNLFTQAERSLDRSQGGLGLGLALVKRLVEMHGGSVSASSDGPGKGSEFVVRLPALEGNPARAEGDSGGPAAGPAASPRRVLLVDDNRDATEMLALFLAAQGHEVRTAHDGPAALALARTYRPDVVFLDIGLPQMDGYEVARRLRGEAGLKDVLVVALTGYGQDEDRRKAREAGFDAHLVKPADVEVLQGLMGGPPDRTRTGTTLAD